MRKLYFAALALAMLGSVSAHASYLPSDPGYNTFVIPDPLNPGQLLSQQWGLQRMNVPEAWKYTQGSTDVKIGVIDTGIIRATPDLQGQFLPPENSVGLPFEGDASIAHGTWVASIINMKMDNGIGGAGVGNFTLQPIRATDSNGSSSDDWINAAITMAVNQNCRVITISLGALSYASINATVTSLLAANKAAGKPDFLVFMAAGNSNISSTTDDPHLNNASSAIPDPLDNIIFATATNEADKPWESSNPATPNVGAANGNFIDLAAPGQDIWVANGTDPTIPYGYANGTSFASPYAASGAAMIWSVDPSLTADQVKEILFETAYNPDNPHPGKPYWDDIYGWGRVDIGAAVDLAVTMPGAIVPEPASLLLLAAGGAGLLMRRGGKRRGG